MQVRDHVAGRQGLNGLIWPYRFGGFEYGGVWPAGGSGGMHGPLPSNLPDAAARDSSMMFGKPSKSWSSAPSRTPSPSVSGSVTLVPAYLIRYGGSLV